MKVVLKKFNEDGDVNPFGLTIGKIYEVEYSYTWPDGRKAYTIESDDDGDENELYDGEFEVVEV